MKNKVIPFLLFATLAGYISAQHISEFGTLQPGIQNTNFYLPTTHSFQYIIETGDQLTEGGVLPDNSDFTGYIPINNSSKSGYLSINSESVPGGVTVLDIELDESIGKWMVIRSEAINFSSVGATIANCSGTVTPWNTVISCEEYTSIELESNPLYSFPKDSNNDGYDDFGWSIEIDPVSKTVIDQEGGLNGADKLWAMGNFKHENVTIHSNKKTVYQGADDTNGEGYLFKFVATMEEDLSSGDLYVYKGDKQGNGNWIRLNNNSIVEQNTTLQQCAAVGATSFGGIEDVEINPIDGFVYFAVKREEIVEEIKKGVVFRFADSSPLDGTGNISMEVYVGGDISYDGVQWGNGNDNLVFDNLGNLWVAQDESGITFSNYIWVIENNHTQENPKVKIFARTPKGSEPTGLTFSPDYRYLFMSIMHPDINNNITSQLDGFDIPRTFDKDVTIMIARKEFINEDLTVLSVNDQSRHSINIYPIPSNDFITLDDSNNVQKVIILDVLGREVISVEVAKNNSIDIRKLEKGMYFLRTNDNAVARFIKK